MDEIRTIYNNIENHLVYFALKEFGVKNIKTQTVETVKAGIAIDMYGLPITTRLLSELTGKPTSNVTTSLHTLGDKYVVNFVPRADIGYGAYAWIISNEFKSHLRI